ncbi:SPOR domain-containing protein [Photobacterium phosphoreum]|uniref:SPOR domain-containing protein n=2 Tax=Photobacterium phosphoreum TaxID=659 RepID=UPI0024B6FDBD|nr:SPOR domain-containing protein [Photobacterium phosphoreum]
MKKIIALSLLSSLVGCAQLMPPKTPLQVPIETINTTKATDTFVEPTIVAELDASVKTDPLYESSDSIAVSEQAITEPEPAATNIEANTVTNTAASAPAESTEPAVAEPQAVEPQAVTAEAAVNSAEITEPTPEAVSEVAVTSTEANTVTNTVASAPASVPAETTEPAVTEPQAVEPQAVTAEAVVNSAEITEPTPEAVSEVVPVAETPTVEDDTSQTIDDSYKTVDMHGYSLQITASRDEQSLVTLLSTLESQQPAWINKKMLNGSQAYTLLVGHYADYDQAKSALALLPQAVQQNGAFVRNFYDIEHTGSPQLKQLQ